MLDTLPSLDVFPPFLPRRMDYAPHFPKIVRKRASAGIAGLDVKGAKAYILRSLLPPKCRAIVKAPDVYYGFFMLVLSLIGFSPSKKIPAGMFPQNDYCGALLTCICGIYLNTPNVI